MRVPCGFPQGRAARVALAYSALPNRDRAFAWLDSAYKNRSLRPLIMDPTFAGAVS